ncbi:MAG: nucleotidyltransferase family protein [Bacteroidales bacterium]
MINGLTKEQNAAIIKETSRFKKLTRLVVFGSRAIGNYKQGSDIDFAVWGLEPGEVCKLNIRLNEYLSLPHKFDVVRFESINSPQLKQHILEFGTLIYPLEKITE